MPFFITGAITAAGGAWNASIVCEYINWGQDSVIMATGIGLIFPSNINCQATTPANIAFGRYRNVYSVVLTNKLFWQQLYHYAEKRFSMNI